MYQEVPAKLLKVIKAFLADIKRTMGVQAFMMVGYMGKDENPMCHVSDCCHDSFPR